jgi:hypothetical protein
LIKIWCCAYRDWPFSSASKPIDLGLGFHPGTPTEIPFCFGFFWGSILKSYLRA